MVDLTTAEVQYLKIYQNQMDKINENKRILDLKLTN